MKSTFSGSISRCFLLIIFLIHFSVCLAAADNSTSSLKTKDARTEEKEKEEEEDALILTKYIRSGNLTEGRRRSEVHLPDVNLANLTSYSGYFTVNESTGSSLFFWFFPAQTGKVLDVPLLLWLQGGPANSFGVGLFVENGPLKVIIEKDGQVRAVRREETAWNREFALLYIDSPAGTGFSHVANESTGYATSHQEVSRDLLEALKQFFVLFGEYRGAPFFLTGQSYAGKFVPSLAAAIHRLGPRNETAEKWGINLQGFAIGNGFCQPLTQLNYGDFLFAASLVDRKQRDQYRERDARLRRLITEGDYEGVKRDLSNEANLFVARTGLQWLYNLMEDEYPADVFWWKRYVALNSTRAALHLGRRQLNEFIAPRWALRADIVISMKAEVEELLEAGYRALFYAGNLDIIIAAPLVEDFVHQLNWSRGGGGQRFYDAEKIIYRVSGSNRVAGYVKQVDNLLFVVVRNAGHLVPMDQPKVALDMITRFVKGQSFKN